MAYLSGPFIGDICIPTELILPTIPTDGSKMPKMSGAIFISGSKLCFRIGSSIKTVTDS